MPPAPPPPGPALRTGRAGGGGRSSVSSSVSPCSSPRSWCVVVRLRAPDADAPTWSRPRRRRATTAVAAVPWPAPAARGRRPDGSTAAVPASGAPVPPFAAQTIAGTIDAPGQTVPTTFDLVAGQLLYVHGTTQCGPQVAYRLLRPGGTQYGGPRTSARTSDGRRRPSPGRGRSSSSRTPAGTGPYAIELAPIRPDTIGALEAGQPATGEILDRGEIHRYRFSGTAGEPVYVVSSRARPARAPGSSTSSSPPPGAAWAASRTPAATSRARSCPRPGTTSSSCPATRAALGAYSDTLVRIPPDVTEPIELGLDGHAARSPSRARRSATSSTPRPATRSCFDGTGPPTTGVAYTLEGPDGAPVGPNPYADGELSAVVAGDGHLHARRGQLAGRPRRLHHRGHSALTAASPRRAGSRRQVAGEALEVGDDEGDVVRPVLDGERPLLHLPPRRRGTRTRRCAGTASGRARTGRRSGRSPGSRGCERARRRRRPSPRTR